MSKNTIAQSWDLSPLFKAARKGAKLGDEGLERIQKMSETLTSGKEVQGIETQWQEIAAQFHDAADKIKQAPLPSDFNMEQYKLEVRTINCETKQTIINGATAYLNELQRSQIHSHFIQEQTASFIDRLNITRKNLDALHKIYSKLLQTPLYEKIWPDWLDIEKDVDPELTLLIRVANQHLAKLRVEFKKVEMKIDNLSGNIGLIEAMKCGGIFRCQQLNFPHNVVSGNCLWNFNLKNVSIEIRIDPEEKIVTSGKLTFTETQEPVNNSRCGSYDSFNFDCPMQKFKVNNSTIYIEFMSSAFKVNFTGTKTKGVIIGTMALESIPEMAIKWNNGINFRIVQNLTLNLKQ